MLFCCCHRRSEESAARRLRHRSKPSLCVASAASRSLSALTERRSSSPHQAATTRTFSLHLRQKSPHKTPSQPTKRQAGSPHLFTRRRRSGASASEWTLNLFASLRDQSNQSGGQQSEPRRLINDGGRKLAAPFEPAATTKAQLRPLLKCGLIITLGAEWLCLRSLGARLFLARFC